MPSTSRRQQRFFGFLKSNPAAARAKGISAKVVDEFARAPGGTTKDLPEQAPKPKKLRVFGSLAP